MIKQKKYKLFLLAIIILAAADLGGCIDLAGKTDTVNEETQVISVEVGRYENNCYLVSGKGSKEAVVIDSGFEHKKILRSIKLKGLTLKAIILTHSHQDHIHEAHLLQKETGATVYMHPKTKWLTSKKRPFNIDGEYVEDVEDGDYIDIGPLELEVIHTPGHSPGSICLYTEGALFTGDLLFKGAVGRTNFEGGSLREIKKSLTDRLAHIPDETKVYPGHGESTSLGKERKTNSFLLKLDR